MRNAKGQLGVALIIMLILGILMFGAVATDTYHQEVVRAQMHNAADAAALGGAQFLWTDVEKCKPEALRIAALNVADGVTVAKDSPGIEITVNVNPPVLPPAGNEPGTVEVIASKTVHNYLAGLFGRYTDKLTARALAGTSGTLNLLYGNQAFPLAVSQASLAGKTWGATMDLNIAAQGPKNAAWTSLSDSPANANWVKKAIDGSVGLTTLPDGFIPSVAVGQPICLNNGNFAMNVITGSAQKAIVDAQYLVIPVINDSAPFNKSSPVVTFVGIDVLSTQKNPKDSSVVDSMTVRLVDPQVLGESGPPIGKILDIGPIKLLQ